MLLDGVAQGDVGPIGKLVDDPGHEGREYVVHPEPDRFQLGFQVPEEQAHTRVPVGGLDYRASTRRSLARTEERRLNPHAEGLLDSVPFDGEDELEDGKRVALHRIWSLS